MTEHDNDYLSELEQHPRLKEVLHMRLSSVEAGDMDALAVILATYFESHRHCPDDDVDHDYGFSRWAMDQSERVLWNLASTAFEVFHEKGWLPPEEAEELRRDAERYRWLRDQAAFSPHDWYVGPEPEPGANVDMERFCNHAVEGLDEAIDAAQQEKDDDE